MRAYAKIKRLSVPEKTAIIAGTLALLAIVAYWGGLAPARKQAGILSRSIATLRKDAVEMRLMALHAKRLRKPGIFSKSKNNEEIGQYLTDSLKKSLVENPDAVSVTGASGLTIGFKSVEYARMMQWLDQIGNEAGLTVEYAKIEPAEEPDRVKAEIVLTK
ncbi:MAG: type II secretion system protein M [Nitrospinae bacterium]|nr:type II secretion system protein M [Nitrospinota bacterium]MBF0633835.1 type II secretion system protein M [Nitrospinota bacterium]